jgi:hypothetical protein
MSKEEIIKDIERLEKEQITLERKCKMIPRVYDFQLEFNIVEQGKLYKKLEKVM